MSLPWHHQGYSLQLGAQGAEQYSTRHLTLYCMSTTVLEVFTVCGGNILGMLTWLVDVCFCYYLQLTASMCWTALITSVEVTGSVSESLLCLNFLVMFSSCLCMSVGSTGWARSVYHWTKRTSCKCVPFSLCSIKVLSWISAAYLHTRNFYKLLF